MDGPGWAPAVIFATMIMAFSCIVFMGGSWAELRPAYSFWYWGDFICSILLLLGGIAIVGFAIRLLSRDKRAAIAFLGLYLILAAVTFNVFWFAHEFQSYGLVGGDAASLENKWTYLYFSIVTWTTLGYGEFTPTPASRLFAAEEALVGSFYMALYVGYVLTVFTFFSEYEFEDGPVTIWCRQTGERMTGFLRRVFRKLRRRADQIKKRLS